MFTKWHAGRIRVWVWVWVWGGVFSSAVGGCAHQPSQSGSESWLRRCSAQCRPHQATHAHVHHRSSSDMGWRRHDSRTSATHSFLVSLASLHTGYQGNLTTNTISSLISDVGVLSSRRRACVFVLPHFNFITSTFTFTFTLTSALTLTL